MVEYTEKERRSALRKEMRKYVVEIGRITSDEQKELREWVNDGNSVYDNPYLLYGDDGRPMDFIDATRTFEDMRRNPENYCWGYESEKISNEDEPF